ncbi:MAG: hypothetical protein ACRCZZ_03645, partial [Phocaeicola sp.]
VELYSGTGLKKNQIIADRYLFFESNIPYQSDVTRLVKEEAMLLRNHHLSVYKKWNVTLDIIDSSNRTELVSHLILEEIEKLRLVFHPSSPKQI